MIDTEGNQSGVVETKKALFLAREKGMDLVEVSPLADPPVCKIQDFGKYKYHQSKIEHRQRQKQKSNELKEIRLSPRIGEHDLGVKVRKARGFLEKGDRVKVNLIFRGREIQHIDIGKDKLQTFFEDLSDIAEKETDIKRQNKNLFIVLKPLTEDNAKNEDS